MAQTVLIVDDDPTQRRLLETVVSRHGYDVEIAKGGEDAVAFMQSEKGNNIDLILLDLVMPDLDGFEVLSQVKPRWPDLPVIVLTAQSGIDVIVKVMQAGAADFIPKPASPERLLVSMENALKMNVLSGQVSRLVRQVDGRMQFDDLITASSAMNAALDLARRGASSNIPILIEGESGVGKEMIARAVQGSSERAGKPIVAVNCGAIPENLVESILFGHEKGAFTGANERHMGKFQEADGGTLFLDEIGELRQDMQVKLLRAIQEGEVDPVGARNPVKVDIRLISATNRDLQQQIAEGNFREDLYYRLNVFPIHVPPLRERQDDIAPLADHFIAKLAAAEGKAVRGLAGDALDLLMGFDWPGNVRQLENAIFRAVVLCDGDELRLSDFPQIAQSMGMDTPMPLNGGEGALPALNAAGEVRTLDAMEADMIRLAITKYGGQMTEVARRLGIGRSTLYRKVAEFGIEAGR
ncbi:MAG: sigma-54-dependent Fis family transcriptional regulator [Rhodospirillaceae bacterium]|jgi:DNA-binding NtrC family response regulator|nr:sigma-54-dependent Fis family transcriptional regulator [Rhodospirillaceae bacterium]MBT3491704.1 sigma-54-dependent Fis family transcriptional regulator [Rhodospirillaceae bacterium]MBT3783240.1 sigma-54-dependent Fis family transcriptional regulator [Rhodospirillaceae bacterium]MBT3978236.1 sigma-54-dependent Fis family transcriptional regulator [Rhodospirillaceae bacterium]MBT4168951.1 sigma-54-dependent Fis family transcriptional regulator [Rhodospirillaceae bacterium]